MEPLTSDSLCAPGKGLSCFACCPPIRPAGYDHLDYRQSLRRLLSEARQEFLAGAPPRAITGFSCPGLGFLDSAGRQAGCLYHPSRHGGVGLRLATGYQPKCARESCPPARAYAALTDDARRRLLALCAGLDAFEFSSERANPARRLLALGPAVAAAALGLPGLSLAELAAWPWLAQAPAAWGWLLGRLLERRGTDCLRDPDLGQVLAGLAQRLAQARGPVPPLEEGQPLGQLCDEWEARCWRHLGGRTRLRPATLETWRGLAGHLRP